MTNRPYELVNVEQAHAADPKVRLLPRGMRYHNAMQWPYVCVHIWFRSPPQIRRKDHWNAESCWLVILRPAGRPGRWIGRIDHPLRCTERHGLHYGMPIEFGPEHVDLLANPNGNILYGPAGPCWPLLPET